MFLRVEDRKNLRLYPGVPLLQAQYELPALWRKRAGQAPQRQ